MGNDAAELLALALRLPPETRAALADSLIESLDEQVDEDAEESWRAEIVQRLKELDSGAVQAIAWDEARRRLRSRLSA